MTTQPNFPNFDMAALTAPGSFRAAEARPLAAERTASLRRRLSPQSGRALEMLGRAIEYLADETANAPGTCLDLSDPRLEAIQILMRANRNIYYAAPVVPGFGSRLRSLFGFA